MTVGVSYLADRAHPNLTWIWAERTNVLFERELWITVLGFHVICGVAPSSAWLAYRAAWFDIDLARIQERERTTRHDVKARIEEFNHVAGGIEYIHLGMTSADVVDNIAQVKIKDSLEALIQLHPQVATRLQPIIDRYPMRGIKGPMGTMQDQIDLIGYDRAIELERIVAHKFGFDPDRILGAVGQVYHRSLDLEILAELVALPVSEPWRTLVLGYMQMMAGIAGDQWNEGDVTTSSVRRVALPGAMLATEIGLQEPGDN
jgi:adenylosuccinate lyase